MRHVQSTKRKGAVVVLVALHRPALFWCSGALLGASVLITRLHSTI